MLYEAHAYRYFKNLLASQLLAGATQISKFFDQKTSLWKKLFSYTSTGAIQSRHFPPTTNTTLGLDMCLLFIQVKYRLWCKTKSSSLDTGVQLLKVGIRLAPSWPLKVRLWHPEVGSRPSADTMDIDTGAYGAQDNSRLRRLKVGIRAESRHLGVPPFYPPK